MQNLLESVRKGDPAATLEARKAGPSASPALASLARDPDAKVRRVALYCLYETGGRDAVEAFTMAVNDADSQVRAAALRGLHHHYRYASADRLLQAYDRNEDPYARQQIMLVVGRLDPAADIRSVKDRYEKEPDPQAREGGLVALAKWNDADARAEFIRLLHASRGPDRVRYLEYCRYLHGTWLLRALMPLLADATPAIRVGVDARPNLINELRICDLVVNLVAEISGHKFSFPVNESTNYSVAQVDEVHAFLRALP